MKIISQLAKHTKKEDDFGRNDDDWDVYKIIRKVHTKAWVGLGKFRLGFVILFKIFSAHCDTGIEGNLLELKKLFFLANHYGPYFSRYVM